MTDLSAGAVEAHRARLGALSTQGASRDPRGPVVVVPVTASTNDDARRAAALGAPAGAAFVADAQTAGRGRIGHTWHSPPGENLYLSFLARPDVPASSIAPVTLAVGVAVAEVIEARLAGAALPPVPIQLKWPNDVLAGGRKIAGVLVEGQIRGADVASLVVGVGVNVKTRAFPPELADRATSLALLGCADLDRASLCAALLVAIEGALQRYEAARLQAFLAALAHRDALAGRRVSVGAIEGTARGIDADGRLLVQGDQGEIIAVASGEVSVRAV